MSGEADRQAATDGEHLKLLSWGYLISGGISLGFSLIGLLYAGMGIFMGVVFSHAPGDKGVRILPGIAARLFAAVGLAVFLLTPVAHASLCMDAAGVVAL